jgi:two-component system, chemotaxis family, protein-glutamate methylesterase/glutaminase
MAARDIIVIGASAGGFDALQKLAGTFPAELPAAVFVTLHFPTRSPGILPAFLNRAGPLPAAHAVHGEAIRAGQIYVAPPDYHLVLGQGHVELSHGPKENMQRPCINVMFRSAASVYGERVAGVLLTGLLDDGASGLWQIQQHHGTTIVQDPAEARFRSMPDSAIRGLNVQYIVGLAEMGPLLARLSMTDNNQSVPGEQLRPVEEAFGQACPDCGGAMKGVRMGELREYRCHIGHRFGLQTMIAQKTRVVEHALDHALSQSEELSLLLETASEESTPEPPQLLREEIVKRKKEQKVLRDLASNNGRASSE